MALVNYSESEDEHPAEPAKLKRKHQACTDEDLPSLPDTFHDLYATNVRLGTQDDPSLHGGRQRSSPHIEGNWPTHIYVEWHPSITESRSLSDLLADLNKQSTYRNVTISTLLSNDLGAELPLHISLSRSIMLKTEQRSAFSDHLENALKKSGLRPFKVDVTGLKWVPNFEGTRWFLVMTAVRPVNDDLNKLLRMSNFTAEAFGQPPLYAQHQPLTQRVYASSRGSYRGRQRNAVDSRRCRSVRPQPDSLQDCSDRFHISIAWSLDKPPQEALDHLRDNVAEHSKRFSIEVGSIRVKMGNQVNALALQTRIEEGKGVIGN